MLNLNKFPYYLSFLLLTGILIACDSDWKADSETAEKAKEANEEKFEEIPYEDETDFLVNYTYQLMKSRNMAAVAMEKATNPEVDRFATDLYSDHGKLLEEARILAQNTAIELPARLEPQDMNIPDALENKTGADFDKAFLSEVLDFHKAQNDEVVELLKNTKSETFVAFGTSIKSQNFIHENRAKELEEKLEE